MSLVYVTLTNGFDKKFVPTFYNYFLKIELNCDKENHVNFKIHAVFKRRRSLT